MVSMSILFPKFYVDQRRTGRLIEIGVRDYIVAAIFASLYVLWRAGLQTFVKAFLVNLVFIALGLLAGLASSLASGAIAAILFVIAAAVLIIEQSRTMVRYVVRSYADRGWDVTPG